MPSECTWEHAEVWTYQFLSLHSTNKSPLRGTEEIIITVGLRAGEGTLTCLTNIPKKILRIFELILEKFQSISVVILQNTTQPNFT
jgi:hypothetical protein